jgi:hypothetical protein
VPSPKAISQPIDSLTLSIDASNGSVDLPNGYRVFPNLTEQAFRASAIGQAARIREPGSRGWRWYHFSGGQIDRKNLSTSLSFHDERLDRIELTVDFSPPGPRNWSNYSHDIERQTKGFHDRILDQLLGRPRLRERLLACFRPRALEWVYQWGRVGSFLGDRGGSAFISIRYSERI